MTKTPNNSPEDLRLKAVEYGTTDLQQIGAIDRLIKNSRQEAYEEGYYVGLDDRDFSAIIKSAQHSAITSVLEELEKLKELDTRENEGISRKDIDNFVQEIKKRYDTTTS